VSKKTKWFPWIVKPVHIGVYETDLDDPCYSRFGYSYWDGNHWGNQYETPETAEEMGDNPGAQDKLWRGMAEPK
jgi:hypothetical protein